MRFKAYMINELANFYEETVIANNENDGKTYVQTSNSKSKFLKAKSFYK